jgi:hypothetical protein
VRTEAEITADARPGRAFSNHTEYDIWASRYCYECANDDAEKEVYCPILGVALITQTTPREWTEAAEPYPHVDACTEFVQRPEWPGDDDPDDPPPPDPVPDCDGQLDLIDAYLPTALAELEKAPVTS